MRLLGRYRPILCTPVVALVATACTTGSAGPSPAGPSSTSPSQHVSVLPPPPDSVEEVIDGRTVLLSNGVQARIIGLAAPGACWATAAASFAKETLLNKPVRYSRASESTVSLRLPGNVDYATLAVSRGAMRADQDDPVLSEAGKTAAQAGLGLWGAPCNGKDTIENPTPPPAPSPTPPVAKNACAVTYRVAKTWDGGFHAEVVITNTAQTPVTGWTLRWTFPSGQRIWQTWNTSAHQNGADVAAANPGGNTTIAAAGQLSLRFNASSSGPNVAPSTFTLNHNACSFQLL